MGNFVRYLVVIPAAGWQILKWLLTTFGPMVAKWLIDLIINHWPEKKKKES